MGTPGQPPVEAGIVDEHDRVGTLMAKIAIGPRQQTEEGVDVGQDAGEPHDGQPAKGVQQSAPGLGHAFAAEADAFHGRIERPELPDEIAAVNVAARFAGADEDSHGEE